MVAKIAIIGAGIWYWMTHHGHHNKDNKKYDTVTCASYSHMDEAVDAALIGPSVRRPQQQRVHSRINQEPHGPHSQAPQYDCDNEFNEYYGLAPTTTTTYY